MHRVHAPDARPPTVIVSGAEAHHMTRVLRLGAGDDVAVFDGRGHEWLGRLVSVTSASATINLLEPRSAVAEPPVRVTLAIAVLKGDQMDAVVRDATMMGAAVVVPFVSAHVAVPERAWRGRSSERAIRVAVASARQCRRAVVPEVRPVVMFHELIAEPGFGTKVICVEPGAAEATPLALVPRPAAALVLVGPEGGWSQEELDRARSEGAHFLGMGPRTLRADAAPTVVLAALWTGWGWV